MKYFAIVCLLFVFSLGCTPAPEQSVPVCQPVVECDEDGCCPKVAGRYHLRGRTKRFFGRVA